MTTKITTRRGVRRFYQGHLVEIIDQVGRFIRVRPLEGPHKGKSWLVEPRLIQTGQRRLADILGI